MGDSLRALAVSCCQSLADLLCCISLALPEFQQEIAIERTITCETFESISEVNTVEVVDSRFSVGDCGGRRAGLWRGNQSVRLEPALAVR